MRLKQKELANVLVPSHVTSEVKLGVNFHFFSLWFRIGLKDLG